MFFLYRAFGFIAGCILIKVMQGKYTHHTMLGVGSIMSGIPFILFPFFNDPEYQGYCILVSSIFCSVFEILITMCLLEANKGNNE